MGSTKGRNTLLKRENQQRSEIKEIGSTMEERQGDYQDKLNPAMTIIVYRPREHVVQIGA